MRVASPVISSGPILGTLAEVAADGKVDLAGVVDATQIHEVLAQWRANGNVTWKMPALRFLLGRASFSGKRSTPYAPVLRGVTGLDEVLSMRAYRLAGVPSPPATWVQWRVVARIRLALQGPLWP